MDPVLAEIYSTIIPSAPFVIAAYVLVWVSLLAYVVVILHGQKRAEAQMALLEEMLSEKPPAQR